MTLKMILLLEIVIALNGFFISSPNLSGETSRKHLEHPRSYSNDLHSLP